MSNGGKKKPYGSAEDLPSVQEMKLLLKGGKFIARFIARETRGDLVKVEADMKRLVKVVDDFYSRLGDLNWVFHDSLSADAIEALLADTTEPADSENRLIELYLDERTTQFWINRLKSHESFQARYHQILRAREHYFAEQFDSCVLQLVAVVDGFVNDFEPSVRKGLTSRDPDEMVAWDSVVGHHKGLSHALKTFTKTIKKRQDDEVFEVYRHGIMHGSVVHFDNVVVATKAWNLLFAVADWAVSVDKEKEPKEQQPTGRELLSRMSRQGAYKRQEAEFQPSAVALEGPDTANEPERSARSFLDAWANERWGLMESYIPKKKRQGKSRGELAEWCKSTYGRYPLKDVELLGARFDRLSTAEFKARGSLDDEKRDFVFRMICWNGNDDLALPDDQDIRWELAVWEPSVFFRKPNQP